MCEEQDCVQFTVNRQSAGFMSLNKSGDRYKAVFSTIGAATVLDWNILFIEHSLSARYVLYSYEDAA